MGGVHEDSCHPLRRSGEGRRPNEVVAKERPDLEEEKNQLVVQNAKMNKTLKEPEPGAGELLGLASHGGAYSYLRAWAKRLFFVHTLD